MCIRYRIRDRSLTALFFMAFALGSASPTQADHAPPTIALSPSAPRPFPGRDAAKTPASGRSQEGSGWWFGTVGIAAALAVCGWVSIASKRFAPKVGGGRVDLRVVGRTNLSPKHSVYLLQVGERVLIVGAGGQGAPSLLGELQDPDTLARLVARPGAPTRQDSRMGDDA